MTIYELQALDKARMREALASTGTHLLLAEEAILRAAEALRIGDTEEAAEVLAGYARRLPTEAETV